MERLRTVGGVLAIVALILTIVFFVMGQLSVIPAILIGLVAAAVLLG